MTDELTSTTDGISSHLDGAVLTIGMNNPDTRNALTNEVLSELVRLGLAVDEDPAVRCIVIQGSQKIFASGADIRTLKDRTALEMYRSDRTLLWNQLRKLRTPLVAGVSGWCLGGGLELALLCDVIIASKTSRFGLPETQLGLIPGAGGTQLLPRLIGKPLAMDLVLTGRLLDAETAERYGLVSRVIELDDWSDDVQKVAQAIASRSFVAQTMAKAAVVNAYETGVSSGLETERALFGVVASSSDATEGVSAFIEKRDPMWNHR